MVGIVSTQTTTSAVVVLDLILALPVWSMALSYADARARAQFEIYLDGAALETVHVPAATVAEFQAAALLRAAALEGMLQNACARFFQPTHDIGWGGGIAMTAIAVAASVLGRRFRAQLQRVLFLVLESLQEANAMVAMAAAACLVRVAAACEYADGRQLLLANADYLVHSVSQHLRHLHSSPAVAPVLAALLQHVRRATTWCTHAEPRTDAVHSVLVMRRPARRCCR